MKERAKKAAAQKKEVEGEHKNIKVHKASTETSTYIKPFVHASHVPKCFHVSMTKAARRSINPGQYQNTHTTLYKCFPTSWLLLLSITACAFK